MTTKIKAGVIEAGAISTASLADTSITAAKLAGTLDLTGKTVTVATATAGDNDTTVASTAFVSTAIANLTDSAPAALDTLNELAAALNDDANFSTTVTNSIATKLPLAGGTLTGDLNFGDSDKAIFGAGSDLQIYHDGSNSVISDAGTGALYIQATDFLALQSRAGENYARFNANGASAIYHDNVAAIVTTATGIDVTGTATMDGLTVQTTTPIIDVLAGANEDASLRLRENGTGVVGAEFTYDGGDNQLYLKVGNNTNTKRLSVSRDTGDISFYEDTGTTAKLFWDASAESLGIGTTSPSAVIHAVNSGSSGESIAIFEAAATKNGYVYINGDANRRKSLVFQSAGVNKFSMGVGDSDELSESSFFIGSGITGGSGADLVIDSSGLVGIGTTTPQSKLETNLHSGADSSLMNANTVNDIHLIRAGYGQNAATTSNAGAKWGLRFVGRNDGTYSAGKSGAIFGVSEDSSAGYNRKVGLAFHTSSFDAAHTERMRIDSSGNVGIGVVPSDWSSSSTALQIGSMALEDFVVSGANASVFYNNAFRNSSDNIVYIESDFASAYSQYNGEHNFNVAPSGTAGATLSFTSAMKITNSANVGIGTITPAQKLSVSGASGSARFSLERSSSNTTGGVGSIQWNALDGHAVAGIVAYGDGNDEGAHIAFNTTSAASSSDVYASTSERMRIDSSGNVKLITANDTAGTSKFLTFGTNSFNRAGIKCTNAATYDGSLEFYTGNSSNFNERMRIDSSGNLLINGTSKITTYPAKFVTLSMQSDPNQECCPILELVGNRNANPGNQNGMIQFWNKTSTAVEVGRISSIQGSATNSGAFNFQVANAGTFAEAMRITSSGNVGIGTTSPSTELHVYSADQNALTVQTNTGINQIGILNSTNSPTYIAAASYVLQLKADDNGWGGTASAIQFNVKATERMKIAHDGETTISGTKMNVISSSEAVMGAQSTGYSYWRVVADNSPNTYFQAGTGQTSSQVKMYFTGMFGSNNTMTVDTPNQRVGIGTTSPSSTLTVNGSVSKSSGSFRIDHPLESKTNTHDLVHSFVEAPQADNIYRGKVDLVDGSAAVNIDTVAGMTEGTFAALNREVQCFTTNESNWDAVKGSVSGNILTIESQNSESTATISWLVIGERQDEHMYDTEWTDDNGKVIVEPLK
jgi:hypothetical protein